jgi:hypothetical protein
MAWVESVYTFADIHQLPHIYQAMQQWSEWAQNLEEGNFPKYFEDIPAMLSAFAHDFAVIHNEWGATLNISPRHIWGDITGFTLSHFLMKSSAISVTSLATIDPGNGLGSKPLVTVSVEASGGSTLGVLRIWPSK